jgi:hypothetical protein
MCTMSLSKKTQNSREKNTNKHVNKTKMDLIVQQKKFS